MTPFATLTAPAFVMMADNVDTDRILPSRFLKTVQRRGLGDALAGHGGDDAGWREQAVPWISLVAGAVAGAAAEASYGRDALWVADGIALALACCTGAAPRLRGAGADGQAGT